MQEKTEFSRKLSKHAGSYFINLKIALNKLQFHVFVLIIFRCFCLLLDALSLQMHENSTISFGTITGTYFKID
jgi:hypothetical protein